VRVRVKIYGGNVVTLTFERRDVTVEDVLRELGLPPTGALVTRGGRPLVESERLRDGDELVVYRLVDFLGL